MLYFCAFKFQVDVEKRERVPHFSTEF